LEDCDGLILCDVGNSRLHLFDGAVRHFEIDEGLARYAKERVCFISVNADVTKQIAKEAPGWRDLSHCRLLPSMYAGWGIDREAACLGAGEGVVVDAGSAVTVDIVKAGRHLGGWIWPGLRAWQRACAAVSPRLDLPLTPVERERMPLSTEQALSSAYWGGIWRVIERFGEGLPIYVTGGDAPLMAEVLPNAIVDERLVFKGMRIMIKECGC